MRAVQVFVAIAVLWCGAAYADSMEGHGTASGNLVLWFSGTRAVATFDGAFALAGQLLLADTIIPFSASGWARGEGDGDTSTMDVEAWATFAASGVTETGEAIVVQGGLTLLGLSAGTSGSSGSGAGEFFATVFIGNEQYYAQGSAEGSASGAFVVPKDPLSMELAGDGFFELIGEMVPVTTAPESVESIEADSEIQADDAMIALLPWETEAWPEELLAQLLDILTHIVELPASDEGPAASD